jgi:hypothetical protein
MPQPSFTRYAPGQQPPRSDQAGQHLGAIAARLTDRGIPSRVSRLGGTPVLTIEEPAAGPNAATVSIDPDTRNGPGLSIDCTCLWTPAPGTAPEATADMIITVLKAISRRTDVVFGDDMPSGLSAARPSAARPDLSTPPPTGSPAHCRAPGTSPGSFAWRNQESPSWQAPHPPITSASLAVMT